MRVIGVRATAAAAVPGGRRAGLAPPAAPGRLRGRRRAL